MQATNQQFKQSFSGSVGSGLGAVFNSSGKRFYILEHKVTSQYHKAGESQRIIIDEIMIGRDPKCQVRFDEQFSTVSREHAAIKKEGENYVLYQLSKTNSTYLNGVQVKDRWYLQNGDEIQLSTNGPKLGFIIPPGEQSMVKSIGLSARLSLFRKQALAPYKKAMTVLSILLVLAIAGGTTYGVVSHKKIVGLTSLLKDYQKKAQDVIDNNQELKQEIARLDSVRIQDSIRVSKIRRSGGGGYRTPDKTIASLLTSVKGSVCYLYTETWVEKGGERQRVSACSGTAFLLNDGTLLTARHCVEPWLYPTCETELRINMLATNNLANVYAKITATYGNQVIHLTNKDFRQDKSYDVTCQLDDGNSVTVVCPELIRGVGKSAMWGSDWASAHTSHSGSITADYSASASLVAGEKLYVLGFPKGLGVDDGQKRVEPIYNELSVARDGLNDARCIMITAGTDHGNSGGPVFALRNGKLVAVGIVSRGDSRSKEYGHLVPVCNTKN